MRRSFSAPGLTQYPVGPYLAAAQERFSGFVVLCLDVSYSMEGSPLEQAVQGSRRFVDEALRASYSVAVVLWNDGIADATGLTRDPAVLDRCLRAARVGGGTDVVPALGSARALLGGHRGDRVVAIFGDGDLGNERGARSAADAMGAEGIRIITCGLGEASAESLGTISTESVAGRPRMASTGSISDSIAGMATGLRRRGST